MSDENEVRPVPPGCLEVPGYCLGTFDGSVWITQGGKVTSEWSERGVWPTLEAVREARERFLPGSDEDE